MAEPSVPEAKPAPSGVFKSISNDFLRSVIEVLVSCIMGGAILFIFILGAGLLNVTANINQANDLITATYLPIVCILPLVVGVIGPLVLEKVRNEDSLSLKGGALVSFLSALGGSFLGAFVLFGFGLITDFKPVGDSLDGFGVPAYFIVSIVLMAVTSVLSTIGGILIVMLLNRAES